MGELFTKLGIDWKLLIANTITFFLVLWILRKFAYRPVLHLLDQRQAKIADGLSKAKQSAESYREFEERKQEMMEQAKTEALKILHQAEQDAEQLRQQRLTEAQAAAAKVLARSKQQLASEQAKMLQSAKAELAGLVVVATGKVLERQLDDQLQKTLAQQAVAALKEEHA